MKVTIELINKEIAEKYLELNINNRPLQRVSYYASMMLNNEWLQAGDTIRFSKTGRLLDGQNRLHAIAKSDTEHEMIVVRGLDDKCFTVIDTGKLRSAKDVMVIDGYNFEDAKLLSPIIKAMLNYKDGKISDMTNRKNTKNLKDPVRNNQILTYAKQNPLILEHAKFGKKLSRKFPLILSSTFGIITSILYEIDKNLCYDFMLKLASGVNLEEKSPILLLRNKIIKVNSDNLRLSSKSLYCHFFIAWNAIRKKNNLTRIDYDVNSEFIYPV